jgi:mRNA-degrading endonuclease RelE of RelBE toxin-antitoxin system
MYAVRWSEQGRRDLLSLRAFHQARIVSLVDELAWSAETETRHRKRLRAGVDVPPEYPDPTWEIRVGPHRVFYAVEDETATILAVRLKERRTTGEIL